MKILNYDLKKYPEIDYSLLLIVFATVCVGLVMLLSASTPAGKSLFNESYHFFERQIIYATIGFVAMAFLSYFDYHNLAKYAKLIYFGAAALLVIVLFTKEIQGSRRWISIVKFQLQPSEIAKPALAVYLSYMVMSGRYNLKKIKEYLPIAIIIGIYCALLLAEPHLSATVIVVSIAIVILICAGMPYIWAIIGIPAGIVLIGVAVKEFSPIRWARITTFFHPFADTQGDGYQITQSLYAIGSGGVFGRGLGQSVQKYSALPEPYNDFIFAIICEELGLIGALLIIALFVVLVIKLFNVSLKAPDTFGKLLGLGISTQLAVQIVFNIGVATSTLPNTGISLPFFSYGGTSMIMLLAEMGIMLNLTRQAKPGYPYSYITKRKRRQK